MLKTNKVLRIRNQQGKTLQIVREHYVREDVPCQSQLCLAGCDQTQEGLCPTLLPADGVTHYILPDCQVAKHYLEILELAEFTGILVMHTVMHAIQHEGGRRLHRRLKALVKDSRKQSVLFHNEFQKYCYCPREAGESTATWQTRGVYEAAVWYYNHLAGQMPIVMLTDNPEVIQTYGTQNLGVYVLSVDQYLKDFWPNLTPAYDLYESLTMALADSPSRNQEYEGYLPAEVLAAGLKTGKFYQGVLNVNRYNAQQEAFLRLNGESAKDSSLGDMLVHGMAARNRTVHGDAVVVELLPRSQWRSRSQAIVEGEGDEDQGEGRGGGDINAMPTARVVGVLQRNWRDYVVSLGQDEEGKDSMKRTGRLLTVPMDWRIPKIRIGTRQAGTLKGQRFIVRIDSWEKDSQYPNGHFVRCLGPMNDLETELNAILVEHQVAASHFSQAQLKEMPVNVPGSPWTMAPEEVARRRDLRASHLIFSIDPKGCEDVDDTLSVRKLDSGGLELGVHIADVTHFVPYNSLTDLEARSRSTTVYLADRRHDMLPGILSADLCSLVSGVDRYAMSVIWELDSNLEVVKVWYGRSVIRSSYKLYYEFAQRLSETGDVMSVASELPELADVKSEDKLDSMVELRWSVRKLMELARLLKERRTRHGALELESTEVTVQMAESREIKDLVPKQSLEIHETIAECMIFANHWVAKKICEAFPSQALLRHHPLPRQEHFENLMNCAASRGFSIETHSNMALAESLNRAVDPQDSLVNKVLRSLATLAMSNAAYFSTGSLSRHEFFHYGLALDFYTHFTSPIRRYADVIVHRVLLAAIGEAAESSLFTNSDLQELCDHMNRRHRAAQDAQRDSVELFQTLFFKDRDPDDESCVADAIILQLRANGLMVHVPRYGLKDAVYLKSKEGQVAWVDPSGRAEWTAGHLTLSERALTVHTLTQAHTYRLLDHVKVRITVQQSHAHSDTIKLVLLSSTCDVTGSAAPDAKQQKAAIIQEVTSSAGERRGEIDSVHLGPDFPQWKAEYGQTDPSKSFYRLLQSISDMVMMDV